MSTIKVRNRLIHKDIIDILYDVQRSCHNGKLSVIEDGSDNIKVTCPRHSGGHESKPACFVRKEDGVYNCFVCNFQGSDFSKFINECFDKYGDFGEMWLLSNYGGEFVENNIILDKIDLNKRNIIENKYLDESILDTFESYHPYMTKRHLTKDIIEKFQIKYDPIFKGIVFPVRDINGRLKFLTRRSVETKRFLIDKNASKEDIYLLNYVKNENTVFVVEAQLSALVMNGWGYPTIATLGAGISKEQVDVLNKTDIRRFILCLDNDQAGWKGVERFKRFIDKTKFVDVITLPIYKDPNDLTKEEFENLLSLQLHNYVV